MCVISLVLAYYCPHPKVKSGNTRLGWVAKMLLSATPETVCQPVFLNWHKLKMSKSTMITSEAAVVFNSLSHNQCAEFWGKLF